MSAPHHPKEGEVKDGKVWHNGHWIPQNEYKKETEHHKENHGEHH